MNARTQTVTGEAVAILLTSDADAKAARAASLAKQFDRVTTNDIGAAPPPARPARPTQPALLPPGKVPRRKINRGIKGRVALLHALAHIELNAIDLACDIIARFAHEEHLPPAFFEDWISVAAEEGAHFALLNARLRELDSEYGDLPAHDGLWEAAENTAHDVLARLAVVPLVLEARGLDVTPAMIKKLRFVEDDRSADILRVIHRDEIGHVASGQRWFTHLCTKRGLDPVQTFHQLVRRYFKGHLKPPFDHVSRAAAGVPQTYYTPLAEGG